MKKLVTELNQNRSYWAFLLLAGIFFEAVALYYQYVLDEWPCVLCIHIRIWITGVIVVSSIALIVRANILSTRILHGFNSVMLAGFVERSWQVLAVERGWVFSDCGMESGLPSWFALDKWFPTIFEVKTSCGYTPLIIGQISMAEILMVTSALLLVLSLLMLMASFLPASE